MKWQWQAGRAPARARVALRAGPRFIILSTAAGVAEIGVLLIAIEHGASLREVLGLALVYQLVGLLASRLSVGRGHAIAALAALTSAATVAFVMTVNLFLLYLTALLLAVGVHLAREIARREANVSTAIKRSARIGGFLLGGFAVPAVIVATALASTSATWPPAQELSMDEVTQARESTPPVPRRRRALFALSMVVHQSHYFAYTYVLIWLLAGAHELRPEFVSAIFAAGWITYTISPTLLCRVQPVTAFACGHLANAALLAAMAVLWGQAWLFAVLWVATGVGGGTVTALRRLGTDAGVDEKAFDWWEAVGHVGGVALAIAISAVSVSAVFACSAVLAVLAALLVARRSVVCVQVAGAVPVTAAQR